MNRREAWQALVAATIGGAVGCAPAGKPTEPARPSAEDYAARAAEAEAQGELEMALTLATRALVLRLARFGPHHPDVARSFLQLGDLRRRKGQLPWARQSYVRALEVLDAGDDDPALRRALRSRFDELRND